MNARRLAFAGLAAGLLAVATPALAQGAVADKWRWLTFLVFGAIIGTTMFVTFLAAKRVKSAAARHCDAINAASSSTCPAA